MQNKAEISRFTWAISGQFVQGLFYFARFKTPISESHPCAKIADKITSNGCEHLAGPPYVRNSIKKATLAKSP